jgi:glycosyltransferase involved in cell wall biosynthesis
MHLARLKPVLGYRLGRGGNRLLMVCHYDPNDLPTVCENIANWQQLSRFPIEVINLWPGRNGAEFQLPTTLDLAQYAGVIIHSTVAYSSVNLFALDQQLDRPFEFFDGLKILMKPDEQSQTNRFGEYIGKKKIDIVITCVPPEGLENVYPRDVIGDVDFLQAYEEIIGNPDYHYEHFIGRFDEVVEQRLRRKQRPRSDPKHLTAKPNKGPAGKALLLMAHEPTLDPRIDWFSEGLAADFEVCEVGICRRDAEATAPSFERLSSRRTRVRVDGQRMQWDFVTPGYGAYGKASLGVNAIERLFFTAQLPLRSLGRAIGALDATEEDLGNFHWLCNYFINVNSALLEASRRIGGFDVIVAADLDTLPAAVALAEEHGVPLVYDAHEYWPYAFPEFRHWEIEFWCDLEKTLLERVTLPLTVSPHLANVMSQHYGRAFDCIPNCAPLGSEQAVDLEAALAIRAHSEDVIFLVQGGFGLQRGFDKLINAWDKVDPRAKLWLRGPDSPEKADMIELAQSKGVFNRGVFFPDAVTEADLVQAARDADIGLVPYEPTSLNNRYCCPNKLSQYMAAGLPIICNELDFVKSIVVDNGVGAAVDFRDEAGLVRTINEYVLKRDSIPALSRRSQELFKTSFNWQAKSRQIYSSIKDIVSKQESNKSEFDFDWIRDFDRRSSTSDLSAQENLNIVYTTQIKRLNEVYTTEIKRLNEEIERIRKITIGRVAYYILRRAARPFKVMAKALIGARGKQ